MTTVKRWWDRAQATPPGRAWKRYGDARGGLLAGGVTYVAFLSIFPIMALAFAVFGLLLQGHPEWLAAVRHSLDQALPGFVQDPVTKKGVIPITLPRGRTIATFGIVGLVGLLWGGLGWLGALRDGIRAIFGVSGEPGNPVMVKLRDLGVLTVLGVAVLVSAVVAGLANGATGFAADHIGLGSHAWLVTLVGLVVQALLNTGIVAVVLRLLSGIAVPRPALRNGALFGGIGLTLLQLFGARLIKGTATNPVFSSISVVVGLLVFLNLIARVLLIAAAWAANDAGVEPVVASTTDPVTGERHVPALGERHGAATADEAPRVPLPAGMKERADAGLPTFSQRTADRTTLAAGAVLGAFGALALSTVGRGIRRVTFRR